jgi:hypothetical protein
MADVKYHASEYDPEHILLNARHTDQCSEWYYLLLRAMAEGAGKFT